MQLLSSLSQNPVAAHAVGEALADVLEKQQDDSDVVIVGASEHFVGTLPEIMNTVATVLTPRQIGIVCTSGIVGAGFLQQAGCAISITSFSVAQSENEQNVELRYFPTASPIADMPASALVMATPISFSAPTFSFDEFAALHSGADIVGGVVNAEGLNGARLGYNGELQQGGALALLGEFELAATRSIAAISKELTVTKTHGSMVMELNNQPALAVLYDVVAENLPPLGTPNADNDERQQFLSSLCFFAGPNDDFVAILGADRSTQSLATSSELATGTLVRLAAVNDVSASDDLAFALGGSELLAPPADGAFIMGRLSPVLTETAAETLRTSAIGGFCASPVFASVGNQKFLSIHGSTTAIFGRHHY